MKNIDIYTEDFRLQWEQFIIGCDAVEEDGLWNKDEYGEMEAFYSSDMTGVILRVIASDGRLTSKEVEYLNKNFGFDYTLQELSELYENCVDLLGDELEVRFREGLSLLYGINEKLAEAYRALLSLACDIIVASDGVITSAEMTELERVRALFEDR